jgi:redox-sensitive bicupin YhaK (pirin superfamily)
MFIKKVFKTIQGINLMIKVAVSKEKDLGGFVVRRALPQVGLKTIGPFVFLDQMGPAEILAGHGMDVRPHPHIGLSTLTYLFEGRILHRDSLGNEVIIKKDEVNWMTSGHGIVHSERSVGEDRKINRNVYGLQFWVGLPPEKETIDPSFQHLDAHEIPQFQVDGATVRVVGGAYNSQKSPMKTHSPLIFFDFKMNNVGEVKIDLESIAKNCNIRISDLEVGIYGIYDSQLMLSSSDSEQKIKLDSGEMFAMGSEVGTGGHVGLKSTISEQWKNIVVTAAPNSRFVVLGGQKLSKRPIVWWNFVGYAAETIQQAKERWLKREFPEVPGETEFIPLPQD